MAAVKRKADEADVGKTDVFVTVQTLGGEAVLPRGRVSGDTVVGELLHQLRRQERSLLLMRLLLGGRQLAAHEQLGDLEVRDPAEGLVLTLLRQVVDAEVVERLGEEIDEDTGILSLRRCKFVGNDAVPAIAYLVQDPQMDLRGMHLSYTSVTDIAPLAEALRGNVTVEELFLSFTRVSDLSGLGEALRVNIGLEHLSLQGTQISDISALADALRVNCRLRRLSLSSTKVGDVAALGEALQVNRSLRVLYLNRTPVTDISALADALRVNRTLRLLSLERSQVRQVGGLAPALRANQALTLLALGWCPLRLEDRDELRDVAIQKGPPFRLHLEQHW